ncbi:sodium:alanine symporter family protein [Candidatus Dependentiae bacterium]|nr:sodium:alanine symporter family protein [Candidatus Dependentiae bacterium]
MLFQQIVDHLGQKMWSFPFLIFVFFVSVYFTFQLRFIQMRYFLKSFRLIFEKSDDQKEGEGLSSFQAFMNILGTNIGNGCLAGIAVAICSGGPGAIVWLLVLATFSMSLRFAEVFLGTYFIDKIKINKVHGGPMAYMSLLPGGIFWSYLFVLAILVFMLIGGNLAQCHAVGMAVNKSLGISEYKTGFFVLLFIMYIFLGGAQRIVYVVDRLVPFKVVLFLVTAIVILVYHYRSIPSALFLMLASALKPQAFLGGSFGFALQTAIAKGFQQEVFASEAGLGTAAVAFSTTKGNNPIKSGILAMLSVFINIHVICFLVALCLIASGVWNSGETSSALVISAYETVFGKYGGWIVLFLMINFAMSVLVATAYNSRQCWFFLFSGKYLYLFPVVYSAISFIGTWMHVSLVWSLSSLVIGILLLLNLMGLLKSLPLMKKELFAYDMQKK